MRSEGEVKTGGETKHTAKNHILHITLTHQAQVAGMAQIVKHMRSKGYLVQVIQDGLARFISPNGLHGHIVAWTDGFSMSFCALPQNMCRATGLALLPVVDALNSTSEQAPFVISTGGSLVATMFCKGSYDTESFRVFLNAWETDVMGGINMCLNALRRYFDIETTTTHAGLN